MKERNTNWYLETEPKMTDFAYKYKRALEERRGHNYQYPNQEQQEKLAKLGYEYHLFDRGMDTSSELEAKEVVENYRKNGYYSRIVCFANNIVGMKYYSVIYRKKTTNNGTYGNLI